MNAPQECGWYRVTANGLVAVEYVDAMEEFLTGYGHDLVEVAMTRAVFARYQRPTLTPCGPPLAPPVQGEGEMWRAVCACGWTGPWRQGGPPDCSPMITAFDQANHMSYGRALPGVAKR